MKLTNLYEEIIVELSNISSQARAWSVELDKIVNNTNKNNITVYGVNYPELYEIFPVDVFFIKKIGKGVVGGRYDEHKSGYNENKQYCVYLDIGEENVISTLNHELRHAFEDYNRISRNKTRLSQTKEATQYYTPDFERLVKNEIEGNFKPFSSILMALYHTSKLEESGYSETVNDLPEKDFPIVGVLRQIMNRSYLNNMPNEHELDRRWKDLKKKVNIPIINKFDDYIDFIIWAEKIIQRRVKKVYKKLQKVRYNSKQKGDINPPL